MTRLALLFALVHAFRTSAGELLMANFESLESGSALGQEYWRECGFLEPTWSQGFGSDSRVFADSLVSAEGARLIRVSCPKGKVGPDETGAQIPLRLEARAAYFHSYFVRFDESFSRGDVHEGGKLPGLVSGEHCSGGQICDGSSGFSACLMWRKSGAAVLYLYHMDKPGRYGEDFPLIYPSGEQVVFTRGDWYQVVERVRINSGDRSDGSVQVCSVREVRFVNNGDLVDTLFFSIFHGGADENWAPTRDSHQWFDAFKIGVDLESVISSADLPQ